MTPSARATAATAALPGGASISGSPAAPAPVATRHRRPGWRDPRIWVGLLILAGSVLLGVKVLQDADRTVGVWAARADLAAGTRVGPDTLRRVELRFTSEADANRYLSADQPLPEGTVLGRAVASGELVPRAALGDDPGLLEVPLAVQVDDAPATLKQGSQVDVWVAPATAAVGEKAPKAALVLDDVVVISAPAAQDTLAPTGTRQVIVGLDPERESELGPALGRTTSGRVVLTRQG